MGLLSGLMDGISTVGKWFVDDDFDFGESLSGAWDAVSNNQALLGAIGGAAQAGVQYLASSNDKDYNDQLLKLQQQKLAADEARIKKHNDSIGAGPKTKPKQVYRV